MTKRATDRNQDEENKRQTKVEKHSECKFFHRINPDADGFHIFFEISKIQNYIAQSNKEKLEKEKEVEIKEIIIIKKKTLKKLKTQIKVLKIKKM